MSKLEEFQIEDSEAKEIGIEGNETEKSDQFEKCNKTLHYPDFSGKSGFQHLPLVHTVHTSVTGYKRTFLMNKTGHRVIAISQFLDSIKSP